MKKQRPVGLILAGGQSKRLFPFSVAKPLLEVSKKSLLEQALTRLSGFDCFVVCNKKIAAEIKVYFKKKKRKVPQFIIEPEGRDTAAAVGFAIRQFAKKPPLWLAVVSADHWFPELGYQDFLDTVAREIECKPDSLFVAGSETSTKDPEAFSQFGWIVPERFKDGESYSVSRFVEKPSSDKIAELIAAGGLINAGMFFGTYEVFFKAYQNYYPNVLNPKFKFSNLERLPIDRAIVEKAKNVRVVPLSVRWEDLGTWTDWAKHVGSAIGGTQKIVSSKKYFTWVEDGYEVSIFGLEDIAVVQCNKKIVVMPLSKTKDMKLFLEKIDEKGLK